MALFDLLSAAVIFSNDTDHGHVVSISVYAAVLCLCIDIGLLLGENRWVNESITAMLIGCITGTVILFSSKGKSSHILRFEEELFFIYLLPPITFNAGFQVKKKQFIHNFLTIMLFGVVGVFISFAIISAGSWWLFPKISFNGLNARDYLALGTIFASTDTVCTLLVLHQDENPRLYSLVFGEGVVNDATSVVLFNAIQKMDVSKLVGWAAIPVIGDFLYLFSTSTILGVASGLLTAYALKALYFGRHSADREIALMGLMAYLSYILAELLQLSGILTVFSCGIVMSHYAWHNVSKKLRTATRHIFATLSFMAETSIFLYVGMDALDIEKWKTTKSEELCYFGSWKTSFSIYCIILFLVMLGHAAFVFPLSILSNYISSIPEGSLITFKHQGIIWWAGLMRGAVSVALAFSQMVALITKLSRHYNVISLADPTWWDKGLSVVFTVYGVTWDPVHATMITSTVIVVLFSTLVFGCLTKPLISILLPHRARENNRPDNDSTNDDVTVPLLSLEGSAAAAILQTKSSLSLLLERPVHTIHAYWRRFDDKYMRPVFGGPF